MAIGILYLLSVVVYGNSLSNQFVFDDYDIFVNRVEITSFTYVPRVLGLITGYTYYRPVRMISYMLDYFLFGPDPLGFHIFNILYHVLAAVFVYVIVFHMGRRHGVALLAAAIFAVHPIQTDAVTYLSGRRDVLFSLFYLMGFYFFLQYRSRAKVRYAVYMVACYVLGLFTKEMAVTLPGAAFAYDLIQRIGGPGYLKKLFRGIWQTYWQSRYLYTLLFVLAVLFVLYKTVVTHPSTAGGYHGGSLSANFLTVAEILAYYVFLLFFPFRLNADYSYNAFPVAAAPLHWQVLLSIAVLLVVIMLVIRAAGKDKLLAFSGLWFFITLLPVCHIFPHHELLAEHYLYLPMFGFALFSATLLTNLLGAHKTRKAWFVGITAVLLIFFSVRSIHRNADWKDDLTLWKKTVQTAPDCARARSNLGKALISTGEFQWAVSELKQALKIKPDLVTAFSNLGVAYGAMGRYDDAVNTFEKALDIYPRFADGLYNLGLTLAKKGDIDRAGEYFQKALEVNPRMASAHFNLGLVYKKRGDEEKARRHFSRAAEIRPDSPTAGRARRALAGLRGD
ncbi:MAG: tetratricopeptide repeat protein [Deltaproteobacteria bacterium]|nr:tetratricopeptide repeat protein [Deltaproteobacteria bacterium]